jgi:hypothetical protein
MNVIRSVVLVAVGLTGALVPQMPSQASELVKLGRLIVTGKRAPAAPVVDDAKVVAPRAVSESPERPVAAARAVEPAADAREPIQVVQSERPAADANSKTGLERGGSVSSAGGERSEPFFSLKSLLRAV